MIDDPLDFLNEPLTDAEHEIVNEEYDKGVAEMVTDKIAEDLRNEYDGISSVLDAGVDDPWAARCKTHIERISRAEAENKRLRGEPTYGAAMNALMEEESKESLAQLYLEAIRREKRLRKCADAMAFILERASSVLTGGCDCWYWPEMKISAEKYRAAFPREEAKP